MPARASAVALSSPQGRWRPRTALACALALGVAVAGCADGRVSDQDQARGTVETFLAQCAADRGVRVLETLNRPARGVFLQAGGARAGCSAVLRRPARPLSAAQLRGAVPRLVRFDGTTAEFAVSGAGTPATPLAVSRGPEGWQIEGPS
jgi:hypothetical protein